MRGSPANPPCFHVNRIDGFFVSGAGSGSIGRDSAAVGAAKVVGADANGAKSAGAAADAGDGVAPWAVGDGAPILEASRACGATGGTGGTGGGKGSSAAAATALSLDAEADFLSAGVARPPPPPGEEAGEAPSASCA